MPKLTLTDLTSLQNQVSAVNTINANNTSIETALENTLSRDGTSPNSMEADLDMNGNQILNLPEATSDTEPIRKLEFDALQEDVDNTLAQAVANAVADAEAAQAAAEDAQAAAEVARAGAELAETNAEAAQVAAEAAQAAAELAETNAETAEVNAETAETNAEAAQAAAEAARDLAQGYAQDAQAFSVSAAVHWNFNTSTTDSDPGNGNFRFNNTTLSSVTQIYVDNLDRYGNDVSAWVETLDGSTATTKGYIFVRQANDPTTYAIFSITGAVTDGTGYRKIGVTHLSSGSGTFDSTAACVFLTSRTGDSVGVDFDSISADTPTSSDLLLFGDVSASNAAKKATAASVVSAALPASPQFTSIELSHASANTLTASSGILSIEGVAIPLQSTTNTHTCQQIEIGHASDTTVTRSAAGVIAVEGIPLYPNLPQNSQSAAYTTVLADAQKHILHPSSDNNARTFTIDSNANVPYPIGTVLTFINQINTVTIAITSDTLTMAGTGSTGSRTLAANGWATALKIGTTSWIISGVGLT